MSSLRLKAKLSESIYYLICVSAAFLMLIPLIWLVPTAFKSQAELFLSPLSLIPKRLLFSNFPTAWSYVPFGRYYINTLIIVFGVLFVQIITITLAAYAFARLKFPGRDLLFIILITQLMITPQSTVLPNYLTIRSLGLLDTRLAVMLPYFASAFGTFLLRQAFMTIPQELEDAAKIDGCNKLQLLWHVFLPVVKPTMLAFSIISITFHWNEFFWPLIITDTSKARPLTVGLTLFAIQAEGGAEWTLLMAATLMVIIPLLIAFLIFQRQFIQSFMQSGIKG